MELTAVLVEEKNQKEVLSLFEIEKENFCVLPFM